VTRMAKESESTPDNYCQISAEYVSDAVEISRRKPDANAGNPNVVKNPRIGDNIENADLVNSYETPRGTALHAQLYHPANYGAAAAPITGGEIECRTMKSIGIDYLSARQIVCQTSRRFANIRHGRRAS
jgi:hypothetical protein